ncbi:MAG: ATP-dependent DNA helicase [Pseudomonadota bacterium]
MILLMVDAREILGPDSPLQQVLTGFNPRDQQLLMAETVESVLDQTETLLIEAGTGTGKTFAYLAPLLTSGKRAIVSTGTRALQDQLFHRDLPTLAKAMGQPIDVALLKGRGNYLCMERLASASQRDTARRYGKELATIREWSKATDSGDRAEVDAVAEDSPVWSWVTSTLDNCLGQKCEFYDRCFVTRARREAQAADMVVVNHHLLLADLAMKEAGFDQFLPGAEAFVVDEAHQLPDIAGQFLGTTVSTVALAAMVDEAAVDAIALGGPPLATATAAASTALMQLRTAAPHERGRYEFAVHEAALRPALDQLLAALRDLIACLEPYAGESAVLANAVQRLAERVTDIGRFGDVEGYEGLRWVDVGPRGIRLHVTPLDTADITAAMITARGASWVFTSATLAVNEDFSHFAQRLGLNDARSVKLESPYPLAERSLIFLPGGLPAPSSKDHPEAVMVHTTPLLKLTSGGAFFLFTSYRALNAAAAWLKHNANSVAGRPILVQGTLPRDALLRQFRRAGNAVLLATSTFWEGVDVPGKALSLVVIDKLPFASPADPLLQARIEHHRRRGENAFAEHQLPQAVLALKQGVGRLLRDASDYGVVALCDPRLTEKSYGKVFLSALSPMPVANTVAAVRSFYRELDSERLPA